MSAALSTDGQMSRQRKKTDTAALSRLSTYTAIEEKQARLSFENSRHGKADTATERNG
jgi:hypothetical protein